MKEKLKIDISTPERLFTEHLNKNDKIFFSGKFGSGKSYFIESYFEKHKSEFDAIVISPVNYEINTNDDIFRLIKLDILLKLTANDKLNLIHEDYSISDSLFLLLQDKNKLKKISWEIIKSAVKLSPVYSSQGTEILNILEKVSKNVAKKRNNPSLEKADYFIKSFEDTDWYYLSNDAITCILKESIPNLKKPVLIIEDLDRIEPGHIFRILNIFSSHYQQKEDKHKFGFTKVILVGDIRNIKNIFCHVYGAKTDFAGYMDKFYTSKPFEFSNAHAIDFYIRNLLFQSDDERIKRFMIAFITFLEFHGIINLRQILKLNASSFEIPDIKLNVISKKELIDSNIDHSTKWGMRIHDIIPGNEIYFSTLDTHVLKAVKIIILLAGGYDRAKEIMNLVLNNPNEYKDQINLTHEDFIPIVEFKYSIEKMTLIKLLGIPENIDDRNGYSRFRNIIPPTITLHGYVFEVIHPWSERLPYYGDTGFLQKSEFSKKPGGFNITTNEVFFEEFLWILKKLESNEELKDILY